MMDGRRVLWTKRLKEKSCKKNDALYRSSAFEGIIFGIDPSLRGSGFSVINIEKSGNIQLLASKTLKINSRKTFVECLGKIFLTTQDFLEKYKVKIVAIEQTVYVQNSRIANILGSARGACLSAIALKKINVVEFPPLRIKKSITGIGKASKEQVAKMVSQLLHFTKILPSDEADATAAALCYFFSSKYLKVSNVIV